MPRIPTLPEGSLRLFGRIDRFTCECPRCGTLLRAYFSVKKPVSHVRRAEAKKARPTNAERDPSVPADVVVYNPLTQRLTCTRCRRIFAVGLVLYPVATHARVDQPYDTKPTWKQLLELRQLSGGYFVDKPIQGGDSVNLAVEGVCICRGGRMDRVCAVHGWDEQLGPKTAAALQELARQAAHPTLRPPVDPAPVPTEEDTTCDQCGGPLGTCGNCGQLTCPECHDRDTCCMGADQD